jgi:hypothetical protein
MNDELTQSFSSGILTLVTFLYWVNLFVWIFYLASEESQKEGDTTGGTFIGALLIYAFVAYLLFLLTAFLVDTNYAWVNLIIIAGNIYWVYVRHKD